MERFANSGSPHWKHPELLFEKKALIPALQQFLTNELDKGKKYLILNDLY
jgi:hypothetical protein